MKFDELAAGLPADRKAEIIRFMTNAGLTLDDPLAVVAILMAKIDQSNANAPAGIKAATEAAVSRITFELKSSEAVLNSAARRTEAELVSRLGDKLAAVAAEAADKIALDRFKQAGHVGAMFQHGVASVGAVVGFFLACGLGYLVPDLGRRDILFVAAMLITWPVGAFVWRKAVWPWIKMEAEWANGAK